jgi:septal ring factor EnvC (AmiA/AmiB activator)
MDKEILEILKRLESKIDRVESRQDETYQIVKALEHSAEVNKAEQDKISNDIAHIKGDVEALRKDISTVEVVTANNYAYIAELKAVK